jgi:DNA-binding IclR family transcriptional regulator
MARQIAQVPPRSNNRGSSIQVITRAGQILRALSEERHGLSLSEVAARVDLPRSTVHRIITALETEGLTAVASPAGRYRLGPEFVRMATGQHGELLIDVRPALEQLSSQVMETVDLSLLIGVEVSFIDQVDAPHRLRAVSAIGAAFPAHCSANGKALLSTFGADALCKLLPPKLPALTENTVTDRSALLEELEEVRRTGYATDREEHTLGISAVGAPIRDAFGAVAAVSIPVPTQRFVGNEAVLSRALVQSADRISRLLGGA